MTSSQAEPSTLRPLAIPADFARVAAILSSYYTQPVTAERLSEWEAHAPADAVRSRIVAIDRDGLVVGCSDCTRFPFMRSGSFAIDIAVDPASRRRGIGSQLFTLARAFALSND